MNSVLKKNDLIHGGLDMKKEKLNKFSIRKLSVGVASVLVGVALAGGTTTAFAEVNGGDQTHQQSDNSAEKLSVVIFKADKLAVGYTVVKGEPTEASVKEDVPDGYKLKTPFVPAKKGTDEKPEYEVAVEKMSFVELVVAEKNNKAGLSYENITEQHKAKEKYDAAKDATKTAKTALDEATDAQSKVDATVEVAKEELRLYKGFIAKNPDADFKNEIEGAQTKLVAAVKDQLEQQFKTTEAQAKYDKALKEEAKASDALKKFGSQLADLTVYDNLREIADKMDTVQTLVDVAKKDVDSAKKDLSNDRLELDATTDPVARTVVMSKIDDDTKALNDALVAYKSYLARFNTLKTYYDGVHKIARETKKVVTPSAAEATEVAFSGVAKTFVKGHPNYAVAMMDANGVYTGKFLKQGSRFKVFGKKTIKGRVCYRLGTQSQWVPAEFLVF